MENETVNGRFYVFKVYIRAVRLGKIAVFI